MLTHICESCVDALMSIQLLEGCSVELVGCKFILALIYHVSLYKGLDFKSTNQVSPLKCSHLLFLLPLFPVLPIRKPRQQEGEEMWCCVCLSPIHIYWIISTNRVCNSMTWTQKASEFEMFAGIYNMKCYVHICTHCNFLPHVHFFCMGVKPLFSNVVRKQQNCRFSVNRA